MHYILWIAPGIEHNWSVLFGLSARTLGKGPLLPFLSPFHSKLCRPSYFRAGIYPEILLPLEPLCPIFVTKVPFLSLLLVFWSHGCHF